MTYSKSSFFEVVPLLFCVQLYLILNKPYIIILQIVGKTLNFLRPFKESKSCKVTINKRVIKVDEVNKSSVTA